MTPSWHTCTFTHGQREAGLLFNAALNWIHPVIIFRKATCYCSPNLEVGLCLIIKVGNSNENLSALRWDHRRLFILVNVPGHVCGAATHDRKLLSLPSSTAVQALLFLQHRRCCWLFWELFIESVWALTHETSCEVCFLFLSCLDYFSKCMAKDKGFSC